MKKKDSKPSIIGNNSYICLRFHNLVLVDWLEWEERFINLSLFFCTFKIIMTNYDISHCIENVHVVYL